MSLLVLNMSFRNADMFSHLLLLHHVKPSLLGVTMQSYYCHYITASNNHNYTRSNIPKMEKIHITLIFECYYFKYSFIGVAVIFGYFDFLHS